MNQDVKTKNINRLAIVITCIFVLKSIGNIVVLILDWRKVTVTGWIDIISTLIVVIVAFVWYKSSKATSWSSRPNDESEKSSK